MCKSHMHLQYVPEDQNAHVVATCLSVSSSNVSFDERLTGDRGAGYWSEIGLKGKVNVLATLHAQCQPLNHPSCGGSCDGKEGGKKGNLLLSPSIPSSPHKQAEMSSDQIRRMENGHIPLASSSLGLDSHLNKLLRVFYSSKNDMLNHTSATWANQKGNNILLLHQPP